MVAMTEMADGETRTAIVSALASALDGRMLLTHPFYRRWEAGELAPGELQAYAVQYRAFEAALPSVLAGVIDRVEARPDVAGLVGRNLADELGHPEPHLALFDRFAAAVGTDERMSGSGSAAGASAGARGSGPAPHGLAATSLVQTYMDLVDEGPVATLAALGAYETQAAAIAASKAQGLRRWYGVDDSGASFWDVHAAMDADHGDWTVDALAMLGADPASVATAARRGADAWWALLDEREAEAPVNAGSVQR